MECWYWDVGHLHITRFKLYVVDWVSHESGSLPWDSYFSLPLPFANSPRTSMDCLLCILRALLAFGLLGSSAALVVFRFRGPLGSAQTNLLGLHIGWVKITRNKDLISPDYSLFFLFCISTAIRPIKFTSWYCLRHMKSSSNKWDIARQCGGTRL